MAFVQFTKVSLAYGDRDILLDAGLNLASGSKAALAGANGSGKSTLMKVIAGKIQPDSGERAVQKGCRVSYLPQSGIIHTGKTLRDEVESAFDALTDLVSRMDEVGAVLQKTVSDDGRTQALLAEHHELHEYLEASGYYERNLKIALVLTGLGFSEDDLERDTGEFSGGWQMRIALAKILLESPDILLLDEPTNYLDIEARNWLESWLKDFTGGYLLVSHDRYFLDVTVNEVYELFQAELKHYTGNYSAYEKMRQVELQTLVQRYEQQQEEITRTEDFIRRFRYQASKAAMVQDRVKRLEKIERIELPDTLKKIHFSFPAPPHSGRIAVQLEGLSRSYGERKVLAGLDLILESGEKLVVVGRNGAGKTTLLRILSGTDTSFSGNVKLGAGIAVGYFSQDVAETMTGSQSVLESMEEQAPTELIPKIRDMLGAFLFRGDDVYKPLSVLSGGEKSRLALLQLLLHPVNLLVLDEPTNHLDLHSKDILLDALCNYTGTVIFVSHDRTFMEALASKTLELSPAGPRLFYGNYAYYLDRISAEAYESAGNSNLSFPGDVQSNSTSSDEINASGAYSATSAAEYREAEKKRQARIRRLQRSEHDILTLIEQHEAKKQQLEQEIQKPEVYSDGVRVRAVQKQLDGIVSGIDTATREWESIVAELEETGR